MKIFFKILVVILALFLELMVLELGGELLFGRSHGMMVDVSYRRTERLAALRNTRKYPSPATQAVFREEMRLMHQHEDWKWELAMGLFIAINGIGIYYYFRPVGT